MYKPPFSITSYMLEKSISIANKLGKISSYESLERMPILRRNNRIRSIHSSLLIEANSLSLEQVKDVIKGKVVIGLQKDIQEIKNAYKAYEMIEEFDGYNEKDLLKAHGILTYLLDSESEKYRNHAEGVKDGENIIFIAPPEDLVPKLMNDLFKWLKEDNETPILIKSCIFHYEIIFFNIFNALLLAPILKLSAVQYNHIDLLLIPFLILPTLTLSVLYTSIVLAILFK